ncbi:hypothetical protein LJC58_03810 [Lachnospiraceae bacterium OttesenSCG-928-D06]|nr:hypothetical protein [Lachnospiraceae bacterium OttesenSCG-928-D06]
MYTLELNNKREDINFNKNAKLHEKSPVVEIFSAMVDGKDISSFGKKADTAAKYIKTLAAKAGSGDFSAIAELNSIRRLNIQPILQQEIKLLSIFGKHTTIGYDESCEIEVVEYANVNTKEQALGQDVTFPVIRKKRVPIATTSISGGYSVDYRRAASGDMSHENELQEEVRKQIRNKSCLYVLITVYNAIKEATGIKYFFEGNGLTKTGVDDLLTKVRRWGKPTVAGDFALLSQFNAWAGYQGVTPNITGISEKIMNELNQNGLLGMYNGAILSEIANPYDTLSLDDTGSNFKTLLPAGLGLVIPSGIQSPIYTVTRGGLTSMTGTDVTTGTHMTRFDLEVGVHVVPGQEYKVPIIHDTSLDELAG